MTRILKTTARDDGTAVFDLPADIVPGTELSLVVEDSAPRLQSGAELIAELKRLGFVGDWADRDDLPNTNEEFMAWRRKIAEGEPY